MKKILLASDGSNFSEGAFEFASHLNRIEPILLTGVFVPQVDTSNFWAYSVGVPPAVLPFWQEDAGDEQKIIERFKDLCEYGNIKCKVHDDYFGFAIPEIKRETKFADLLLIGSQTFYHNLGEGMNDYIVNILHKAECPVLLVPETFIFPQSNVLAYDGSDSSVHAIKQFAYLFPELCDNPTLLVYCEEKDQVIPEKENMRELAAQHFSNLQILELEIDSKKYFSRWVSEKRNSILVSGGFGRSVLSELFRKNFVSEIIKEHQLPVFIAHK